MAKEQRLHGSLVSLWTDMLLLALFLHVTVDAAANCSKLKAFAGKQEIDSSLFCTTEFSDTECLPFVESFNVSHLPKKFHTNTLTVERPSAINLVGLVKNYTREKFGPGVRVTWDSPIAEISRHNLEGFLLLLESKHKTSCRLFHFKPNSIELRKMMTFSYDIDRLSDDTFYKLSVFSMPPPSSQDRNDSSRYVDMMLHTFSHYTAEPEGKVQFDNLESDVYLIKWLSNHALSQWLSNHALSKWLSNHALSKWLSNHALSKCKWLSNYTLSKWLSNHALSKWLSNHALSKWLSNHALSQWLSNHALSKWLSNHALSKWLSNHAFSKWLSNQASL
uniref:Fibronectin type-III domain-containing protein n=1 Tax=Biomphalaria glabrata TaxID=6526 RepID=A0A2C9KVU8_BIOGL